MTTIKELLSVSWCEYTANFKKLALILLGIELLPMLIGLITMEISSYFFSSEVFEAVTIINYIFWNISYVVFLFLLLVSISGFTRLDVKSAADDFKALKGKFLGLLGVFFIWSIIMFLASIPIIAALYLIYDETGDVSSLVVVILSLPTLYVFYKTIFMYSTFLIDDVSPIDTLTESVNAAKRTELMFKGYIICLVIWLLNDMLLDVVSSLDFIPVYVQWVLNYGVWLSTSAFGLIFLKNLFLTSKEKGRVMNNNMDNEAMV